jgi:predicted nuclease with TOPRIM domain
MSNRPTTLKLGSNIEVNENYKDKTSVLNLNGSLISNVANAISEKDAINLGQLKKAIEDNDKDTTKQMNDLIELNKKSVENLNNKLSEVVKKGDDTTDGLLKLKNKLDEEIKNREKFEEDNKSNISEIKENNKNNNDNLKKQLEEITNKIDALYLYFFDSSSVDLSKN